MFVLYDGLPLQSQMSRGRGIGRYAANLLAGLRAARPGWRVEVLTHAHLPPPDPATVAGLTTHAFAAPFPIDPFDRDPAAREANELYLADRIAALRPDFVVHSSLFHNEAVLPRYTAPAPRHAAVVYDLIPVVFAEQYLIAHRGNEWYADRFRSIAAADLLLAISGATAADTRRLIGPGCPPAVNIQGAADSDFRPLPADDAGATLRRVRDRFGLGAEFVLYVGGIDFRKNMSGAIAGYATLPPSVRDRVELVLACKVRPEEKAVLLAAAERHGVGGRVKVTGYVSDDELRALYQTCRVFFFPSLYEGLGLPVVEAMRCGAPVVAADNSSLPEFAGPVSWPCDAASPASMAAALQSALAEPKAARTAERAAFAESFTWEKTGRLTADAIEAVCARPPAVPTVPVRPRVAWASPMPPAGSGIADYSAEVLGLLNADFDIDVVVDGRSVPVTDDVARANRVVTAAELPTRHAARPYDVFVYHVGNSVFHTYQLPLLARFPGMVVLHDFYLGGLVRTAAWEGVTPHDPVDEIERQGDGQLAEWARIGWLGQVPATEIVPLNTRVLDAAEYVLVHSGWAWDRVRRAASCPVGVVPMYATDQGELSRPAERERLGIAADEFVVATLGLVGGPKRIPAVVSAAARLPKSLQKRTRVLVVGQATDSDRAGLNALAEREGFAGALEFRGRVPLADLPAYAVAADATVQLRYPSRGESSAVLLRALLAGAACVTSDQGTMAELPNSVTLKVRSPGRDIEDLAGHLTTLAARPDLRDALGAAGRRYALAAHGGPAVAARYATAMRDCIARTASAGRGWRNAVANALADVTAPVPAGLIEEWARLRALAVAPAAVHETRRAA